MKVRTSAVCLGRYRVRHLLRALIRVMRTTRTISADFLTCEPRKSSARKKGCVVLAGTGCEGSTGERAITGSIWLRFVARPGGHCSTLQDNDPGSL